jgi:hypothetical protein
MSSFEVQKAVEFEKDNKFQKGAKFKTGGPSSKKKPRMPEILQVEDEGSRPQTQGTDATNSSPPQSGDPTPLVRPFAGMRDQGRIPSGVDKLKPKKLPGFGRRVSIAENIAQLGLTSPFSPSSPASPTTLRSPLRFFRRREDLRDEIMANTVSALEHKTALVLRERVKDKGVARMDEEWERTQRRKLILLVLYDAFFSFFTFMRMRVFSGWGKWLKETFVVGHEELETYMKTVRTAPLHTVYKLRALEALLNLSYSSGNQLVMIQNDMLLLVMGEVKAAHDGSEQQACALAIIRNLCLYSGYRVAAAKEVTEMLVAVCWAVEDNVCKQHALGALSNLAANERPGEIILEQDSIDVILHHCTYGSKFAKLLTDPERHVRCLALMLLFNLSVVPKNRHRLIKHKVLETLQPLLGEPAAVGLLATIASMHLITQKGHTMLIFSERQKNIPEMVTCLRHSLQGTRFYGLTWNPRYVLTCHNKTPTKKQKKDRSYP